MRRAARNPTATRRAPAGRPGDDAPTKAYPRIPRHPATVPPPSRHSGASRNLAFAQSRPAGQDAMAMRRAGRNPTATRPTPAGRPGDDAPTKAYPRIPRHPPPSPSFRRKPESTPRAETARRPNHLKKETPPDHPAARIPAPSTRHPPAYTPSFRRQPESNPRGSDRSPPKPPCHPAAVRVVPPPALGDRAISAIPPPVGILPSQN